MPNVAAYDDLAGKVVSGEAEAHASSWHDTTNSFYLFGKTGAFVWAHHALGGVIESDSLLIEKTWGTLSSKASGGARGEHGDNHISPTCPLDR